MIMSDISKDVERMFELEEKVRQTGKLQWADPNVGEYNRLKQKISRELSDNPDKVFDFLAEITSKYHERLEETKDEYQTEIDQLTEVLKFVSKKIRPYLPRE